MTIRTYLLIATGAYIATVTGSDLVARMVIAGNPLGVAMTGHLRWALSAIMGLLFLFAPFAGAALICGVANRRARTQNTVALFIGAMMLLAYFYFGGFQASQQAMLDRRWTAAALSIGLLPFFIGLPLLGGVAIIATTLARFDRPKPAETC